MHKITLICSTHRDNGLCNSGELLKIFRAIEPEVVFEEIRPSDFDLYCKHGARSRLEGRAIERYLEFKLIRRVPVDRYDTPENQLAELMGQFDSVFDYVEQTSREYQFLSEGNDLSVRQFGFGYLNSIVFSEVETRMSEIQEMTINQSNDQDLIRALEKWRHMHRKREQEMVRVIYEYCRANAPSTGVFLIGAAHKIGIVKEIEKLARAEADLIDWKLRL